MVHVMLVSIVVIIIVGVVVVVVVEGMGRPGHVLAVEVHVVVVHVRAGLLLLGSW